MSQQLLDTFKRTFMRRKVKEPQQASRLTPNLSTLEGKSPAGTLLYHNSVGPKRSKCGARDVTQDHLEFEAKEQGQCKDLFEKVEWRLANISIHTNNESTVTPLCVNARLCIQEKKIQFEISAGLTMNGSSTMMTEPQHFCSIMFARKSVEKLDRGMQTYGPTGASITVAMEVTRNNPQVRIGVEGGYLGNLVNFSFLYPQRGT
ncbi:hypothetical protein T265_15411, partial [Opisthorchis viverrini]